MNNLFNSAYIQVVNGNLFTASFDAKYLKMSNETDYVINTMVMSDELKDAVANTLILPKATGAIRQLGNSNFRVKASQIVDSSTSTILKQVGRFLNN